MPTYTSVDYDPFASPAAAAVSPPSRPPSPTYKSVDYDPFAGLGANSAGATPQISGSVSYAATAPTSLTMGQDGDMFPQTGEQDDPALLGRYGRAAADVIHGARVGLDSVSRPIEDGVTFGLLDKGRAASDMLAYGGSFHDNLANEQALTGQGGSSVPGLHTALSILGGVGGGAIMGGGGLASNLVPKGAGILTRGLGIAGDGAAFGVADAAGHDNSTSYASTLRNLGSGAVDGALAGVALPVIGKTIGAGYRAAAPFFSSRPEGMSRVSFGLLGNALPTDASATIDALGPHAMPLDTSPSVLGLAQGVAATANPGQKTIVDALSSRAQGTSDRLVSDLDQHLGQAQSPMQFGALFDRQKAAASPIYQSAFADAPPVDISGVLGDLSGVMRDEKGPAASDLQSIYGLLRNGHAEAFADNGMPIIETRAGALHNAKEAIGGMIEKRIAQDGSAAASATRGLSLVRGSLNDALETQVPGYADANRTYQNAMTNRDAYEYGRSALKGGENAQWPVDLQAAMQERGEEANGFMRDGARSYIGNAIGTNSNDYAALNKIVGGENDFNRPKMGALFGADPTQAMVDAVGRESRFGDAYNKVVQGSQSAQRLANSSALDAAAAPPKKIISSSMSAMGAIGAAGEGIVRKGFDIMARNSGARVRSELGDFLAAQGPQASQKTQMLAEALVQAGTVGRGISSLTSSPAALAAALAAYEQPRAGPSTSR